MRNIRKLVVAVSVSIFFWAAAKLALFLAKRWDCPIDFKVMKSCEYHGFEMYRVLWYINFGGQVVAILMLLVSALIFAIGIFHFILKEKSPKKHRAEK